MQRKPSFWFLLSLLCLGGALYFWHLGDQWQAKKAALAKAANSSSIKSTPAAPQPTENTPAIARKSSPSAPASVTFTNAVNSTNAAAKTRFPYRLSNTTEKPGSLVHNDHAILLANALIDTGKPMDLAIPDRLRAPANNGSYVVQSRGPLDDQFRSLLQSANATIVSYIPNNAYLVRVSDTGAQQLSADPQTQSVLPYEPYYKLDSSLLKMAMEQPANLPGSGKLNLTLFSDAYQPTVDALQQLGAQVMTQDRSPFGPVVTVQAVPGSLSAIASLPGVKGVEPAHARKQANDLDRVRLNVAADEITGTNYLGLTGTNILVSINDGAVDAQHPDLLNRIFSAFPFALTDTDGHGTHVAGTILGSGTESSTVTNAQGSVSNANFRGMAPNATAFVQPIFLLTDSQLQEGPARTNALISNNSWNFDGDFEYDIEAASYDAAVRDALPQVTGPQPVLFVFSAGNSGAGFDDGTGGFQDTILSPATAKNVITVGAIEQPRMITNLVTVDGAQNNEIFNATDNGSQVAGFSGRGNVGINLEGDFGRFKPDVVAPGTFVISDRSTEWDTNFYYNPVVTTFTFFTNNVAQTNLLTPFLIGVPDGIVQIIITLETNAFTGSNGLPTMPIYVRVNDFPTTGNFVGNNQVTLPGSGITFNPGDTVFFDVGNTSNRPVNFDVQVEVITTNDVGDFFTVLADLNAGVGPFYRYESGTSMAAAGVTGMLTLMQEFFTTKLQLTNSPALMKALLINGSRSLSDQYDCATRDVNTPTFQGWGLPSLVNSIPPALSNVTADTLNTMPLQFFDQSPTNALATGQSITRNITLTPTASLQNLRVTLVWTDPPGDPQAGVKLVNDLDLIVTNLDTMEVFYGNDIPIGKAFNQATDTNNPPNIDSVNNVENVFLSAPLGTNYSITVFGRRVNVNAVTANTNGIVQDYALVISSGDGVNTNGAFTLTNINSSVIVSNNAVSNVMVLSNAVPLLNQRVGANSQFSGSPNGVSNQWNFYIYTNIPPTNTTDPVAANFTNVAFITFDPPNLGVPQPGANSEVAPPDTNATRFAGADIDLYVSTDPTITNLNPIAIANATKAVTRLGNEVVFFTNSAPGKVYYVGVKSEDQQAAQFNLIGFATDVPFSQLDQNGNATIHMNTVPLTLPNGVPTKPGSAFLFGVCINPIQVRKAVVTNTVECQDFGDYIGSLAEGQASAAVLNNHSLFTNVNDIVETLVYDDSGESEFPNAITSAGPGTLRNFVGVNAMGTAWIYTIVNDSSSFDTGTNLNMSILLERQFPPNSGFHRIPPLAPNSFFFGFVDVPPNATNLTISVAGNVGLIDLLVKRGAQPSFNDFDKEATFAAPGGSISITKFDNPPLNAGRYFFAVHTHNAEANLSLAIQLEFGLTSQSALTFRSIGNEPLQDDAVTYSTNHVAQNSPVVSAEVGVRIQHSRESDLVMTLISPQGTRVLLAENRGGLDTNGYGNGTNIVLVAPTQNSGGAATATNIINVGANFGTVTVNYNMFTIPDELAIYYDGLNILDTGFVSGTGVASVPFGPGNSTSIEIVMNPKGNPGTNTDQWTYTATVTSQDFAYAIFTEDTNLTTTPIKFAVPPFGGSALNSAAQILVSNSFENVAAGSYGLGSTVDGWSVIATNANVAPSLPAVVTVPNFAPDGSNVFAMHNGTITRILPTIAGHQYTLNIGYHGRPAPTPLSWWKADGTRVDSADGNELFDIGPTPVSYAPGVVGQAFVLNRGVKLRADDAKNLILTNAITVEGWVSTQNANTAAILQRGDVRSGFDPYTMGVGPPTTGGQADLQWQVTDTNGIASILFGPMSLNVFTHVAGTYFFDGTNGQMALYVNGLQVATLTNGVRPIGALLPGFEGGLGVGNRGDNINGFAFTGLIDELTLYNQALSAAQVQDIFAAGSAGKDPLNQTPTVTAEVIFGSSTNTIAGLDDWTAQRYTFTASADNMQLTIVPNQDGMLLDNIELVQAAILDPANDFLPEEPLSKLVGQNSAGDWKLEVLDNRAGATNPQPTLVSWQLSLQIADTLPQLTSLVHGVPQTNTVAPNSIAYYAVPVPSWAKFATNIFNTNSSLKLLFDQTVLPGNAGPDFNLGSAPLVSVLSTNGTPPLLPGQTYFLGVQNPTAAPIQFTIEVDFDITTLTNMIPVSSTIAVGNTPRYFQFDVSSNAVIAEFQILKPDGNVELVVSKGAPLPDTTNFTYNSAFPGASPQNILVLTNTQPVPIGPGRWYLGVFNTDANPVDYTIRATEGGPPNIIILTNGVPYTTNVAPGLSLTNFYLFPITNNFASALFELYNLSGDVDLELQSNALPYAPPFFAESANPGTTREQIVLRTNELGTNLIANWFMSVPNNTTNIVTYTIRALATNGLLVSGSPIGLGLGPPAQGSGTGPVLTWTSVVGECYDVQTSTDLTTWTTVATVTALGETSTYTDPNPISGTQRFYQVVQVACP